MVFIKKIVSISFPLYSIAERPLINVGKLYAFKLYINNKVMRVFLRAGNEGFTGLEAAIVLLAFIVVAAVFSYVILGAGFFSVQKSQETIYSAVETASSPITIDSEIFGIRNETSGNIGSLMMVIGKKYGSGNTLDISEISVIWSDKEDVSRIARSDPLYIDMPPSGTWGIIDKQGNPESPLYLENGEYATLVINMSPEYELSGRDSFTFELLTSESSISFSGIAPLKIDRVTTLHQNN